MFLNTYEGKSSPGKKGRRYRTTRSVRALQELGIGPEKLHPIRYL